MFKRVRWIGMGAVAGVSASAWAQRRVRRTLDQHPSIQVGADVATTARQVGREVAAAVRDGRRAMVQREAALRADLAARSELGRRPGPRHSSAVRPATRRRGHLDRGHAEAARRGGQVRSQRSSDSGAGAAAPPGGRASGPGPTPRQGAEELTPGVGPGEQSLLVR